jgi:hypothetical protein
MNMITSKTLNNFHCLKILSKWFIRAKIQLVFLSEDLCLLRVTAISKLQDKSIFQPSLTLHQNILPFS